MAISPTLGDYLEKNRVSYDLIPHDHTEDSAQTAQAAQVPGNQLAKAVVMKSDQRYIVIVLQATEHVDMAEVKRLFGQAYELASEAELGQLFPDCAVGAIPPLGTAWGLEVYVDRFLLGHDEIYFEAGDHEDLIRISGDAFDRLLGTATKGRFGHTL